MEVSQTAQGWKCFASLALNLLSIRVGICWGAEVRPSSVLHLSLESKQRATLVPPPSPLYGCCALPCLPWDCSPPINFNPSGRCWHLDDDTSPLRTHSHQRMPRHFRTAPTAITPVSLAAWPISARPFRKRLGRQPQDASYSLWFSVIFAVMHYHCFSPSVILFILTHKFLLCFAFHFLFCPQGLTQLVVVNPARHGAELGGHVPRSSFHLGLIPSLSSVTTMEIRYKCTDFVSVLTSWDILTEVLLLVTAMWKIPQQLIVYLDLAFAFRQI